MVMCLQADSSTSSRVWAFSHALSTGTEDVQYESSIVSSNTCCWRGRWPCAYYARRALDLYLTIALELATTTKRLMECT